MINTAVFFVTHTLEPSSDQKNLGGEKSEVDAPPIHMQSYFPSPTYIKEVVRNLTKDFSLLKMGSTSAPSVDRTCHCHNPLVAIPPVNCFSFVHIYIQYFTIDFSVKADVALINND